MLLAILPALAPRSEGSPEVAATLIASPFLGEPVAGRLLDFSLSSGLSLERADSGETLSAPAEEVLAIRIQGDVQRSRTAGNEVEVRLSGGDVLYGRPVGTADDVVQIDGRLSGRIGVPLERIDRWINLKDHRDSRRGPVPDDADEGPAHEDVLVLTNGDVMKGTVATIDERGVMLDTESGLIQVPHDRLASADLVADPPPPGAGLQARVRLVDGSQLTTSELSYAGGEFALRPFTGDRVNTPLERVSRIDVTGGNWVWLNEALSMSVQHTPMLSLDWPYVEDANVLGRPMCIGGRSFERGLGVHSESSLLFDLAGQFREFVTYLGVDDAGGELADVTAEIRVDGRTVYRKENLRRGEVIGPVRVDVAAAGRIELLALFGENGSIQDYFDWAAAGLVR